MGKHKQAQGTRARPFKPATILEVAREFERLALEMVCIHDAAMKAAHRALILAERLRPFADVHRNRERAGKKC